MVSSIISIQIFLPVSTLLRVRVAIIHNDKQINFPTKQRFVRLKGFSNHSSWWITLKGLLLSTLPISFKIFKILKEVVLDDWYELALKLFSNINSYYPSYVLIFLASKESLVHYFRLIPLHDVAKFFDALTEGWPVVRHSYFRCTKATNKTF